MIKPITWLVFLMMFLMSSCDMPVEENGHEQAVEAGNYRLTVSRIDEDSDTLFDEAPTGTRRLVIDIVLENQSSSALNVTTLLMFELERANGETLGVELFDPRFRSLDGSLAGGSSRQGTLVFFVSDIDDRWQLLFSPETFSPGTVSILITLE